VLSTRCLRGAEFRPSGSAKRLTLRPLRRELRMGVEIAGILKL
jgi:hypothetical protein